MKYNYECVKCKKQYSETRGFGEPQWFKACDLCGEEYVQIGDPVELPPVIEQVVDLATIQAIAARSKPVA